MYNTTNLIGNETYNRLNIFSEMTLLRFLRGRKHDVEVALKSLVRHAKWRVDEAVAEINEEDITRELEIGKLQVNIHKSTA